VQRADHVRALEQRTVGDAPALVRADAVDRVQRAVLAAQHDLDASGQGIAELDAHRVTLGELVRAADQRRTPAQEAEQP